MLKEQTEVELTQMNKEVKNLNDLIRDADEERKRQHKELQQVVQDVASKYHLSWTSCLCSYCERGESQV